jgi:hypothetical protein
MVVAANEGADIAGEPTLSSLPSAVAANEGVDIAGELIIIIVKASRMAVAANKGVDIAGKLNKLWKQAEWRSRPTRVQTSQASQHFPARHLQLQPTRAQTLPVSQNF